MNTETFGELVQQYRHYWKIDIPTFCSLVGISASKYSRLVRGEASVSIRVAKSIFSVLAISQNELSQALAMDADNIHALGMKIFDQLNTYSPKVVDQSWIKDTQAKLTKLSRVQHNPGVQQLLLLIELYSTEVPVSRKVMDRKKLVTQLMDYQSWTGFEFGLFMCLLPFLTFSQLATGYAQFMNDERRSSSEKEYINAADDHRVDPFFVELSTGLLKAALETGVTENVSAAVDWVLAMKVSVSGSELRAIKRLAAVVKNALIKPVDFETDMKKFRKVLHEWGVAPTDKIARCTEAIFDSYQEHVPAQKVPSDVPLKVLTRLHNGGGSVVNNQIKGFRQAKKVATANLTKTLGVSYATYHRLELGDEAVGFDILLAAMNYLRVSFDELRFFYDIDLIAERRAFQLGLDHVLAGNEPPESLLTRAKCLRENEAYKAIPAFRLLSEIVRLTYDDLMHLTVDYTQGAKAVIDNALKLGGWGDFVIDFALGCLDALSFDRAKLILTTYLHEDQITSRYLTLSTTLLSAALHDHPRTNLAELGQMIQRYFVRLRQMDLLAMRSFIEGASLMFRGQSSTGRTTIEQILARYEYLWPSNQNVTRQAFKLLSGEVFDQFDPDKD